MNAAATTVASTDSSIFAEYAKNGWALTPITPGNKRPTHHAWNERGQELTDPRDAVQLQAAGLCHAWSGTCAIDIDEIAVATAWLAERGVDLKALLLDPTSVQIRSPRKNRGKLIYRLPTPLRTLQLADYTGADGKPHKALELRCATAAGLTMQDVLPPSPHPDGGHYEWFSVDGHWAKLPPLPESLHALWKALASATPAEVSVDPTVDKARLVAHLATLSPDLDYNTWLKVGQGLHHEYAASDAGFKVWNDWSALGIDYPGEAELRYKWQSFTAGGGVTGQYILQLQNVQADEFPIVPITQPTAPKALEPIAETLSIDSVLTAEPELKPVEYVIDGFLATGLTTIAGTEGVGKTSLLVPLAAAAAHLIQTDFPIELRRKVIYVAEDVSQVERALYGLWKHAPRRATTSAEWRDWFVVLPAKRVSPKVWGATIAKLVDHYSASVNGYRVGPLVVLDTANATLDVESENDNAQVGRAIASIKENLRNAACWLVTHVPKALSRKDVEDLVIRGANAWSADANATAYIFNDEKIATSDRRFMLTRKVRFERQIQEVQFSTSVHREERLTPWGSTQLIAYRYGLPAQSSVEERKDIAAQATAEREAVAAAALREEIINLARERKTLTKNEARDTVKRKRDAVYAEFENLITDGVLVEAPRPTTKGGKPARAYALAEHAKLETMSNGADDDFHELLGVAS